MHSGLSKLMGEGVLDAAARTALATSFVSLRFTNIVKREMWGTLPWPAPTAEDPLPLILWAYTHEDDVIAAHVAAATRDDAAAAGAHEAYLIAAPDTRFAEPTMALAQSTLGITHDDMSFRGPPEENFSPLCADKARERLGFAPRSWRADPVTSAAAVPLRGSPAAHRALADPEVAHFDVGGFTLGCGTTLPAGATLAYKVHGPPVGQSEGIVLHPTSYDAVHDELEYNIGPGRTLDTSRFTVIVPNLMGNGVSYSPSLMTSAERHSRPPPLLSVADNVRAQRALLHHLGVGCTADAPLALVYGYSMGALQAYEWAVAYPDAVERIAAVCGAARCGELNGVFLRSIEAALKADPAWDASKGHFTTRPTRGLAAFGSIYAGWGVGSGWYLEHEYTRAGFASADDFVNGSYLPAFASCDADDLLSQIRTWRAADVTEHTGGDFGAALARVRASVLLMPSTGDRYFTVQEAKREAALLGERVRLRPIVSNAGHRAGDPGRPELAAERGFLKQQVHEFMAS